METPAATTIQTDDGAVLAVRDHGTDGPGIVIAPAMAVPQRTYRHIATGLVERGFRVTTFDYRGVAASPSSPATVGDWAQRDLPAVIAHTAQRTGGPVSLIGHSIGGQIAGLVPNPGDVRSMVTVAAIKGWWGNAAQRRQLVRFQTQVAMPLLTRVFGRAPGRLLGIGEDVPAGAARQWFDWASTPDYLFADDSLPLHRFEEFTAPVLAYSIDDDPFGSPDAVEQMMGHYPVWERRHIVPADYGLETVGHMGVFRPGSEPIWDELAAWISES